MNHEQAFAIVRLDLFQEADIRSEPEVIVTVKKVVWAREVAESEVSRLNRLNEVKGAMYFWTFTRVEQR
jgi:hypothetical protein